MARVGRFVVALALVLATGGCASTVTGSAPTTSTQSVVPRLKGSALGRDGVYHKATPKRMRDDADARELPEGMLAAGEWPTTCDAAARDLLEVLTYEGRERLRKLRRSELIRTHFSLGAMVRDRQGLWRGNARLLESCSGSATVHPDTASMQVIRIAWRRAQRVPRR